MRHSESAPIRRRRADPPGHLDRPGAAWSNHDESEASHSEREHPLRKPAQPGPAQPGPAQPRRTAVRRPRLLRAGVRARTAERPVRPAGTERPVPAPAGSGRSRWTAGSRCLRVRVARRVPAARSSRTARTTPVSPAAEEVEGKLPLIIGAGRARPRAVGTIGIGVAVSRGGDDPVAGGGTGGGGGTSSAPPAEAKLPSDAVQGYLEALAAGDATTALDVRDAPRRPTPRS